MSVGKHERRRLGRSVRQPGVAAVALLLLLAAAVGAELTPFRSFRNFDKRNAPGLPQSTVSSLLQDEQGVLWIATLDGLALFDGTAVRPVAPQPGAPVHGALWALAQRRGSGLYVGGSTAVHVFDGESWQSLPAPEGADSLAEDVHGALWRVDQAGKVWWLAPTAPDGGEAQWRPPPFTPDVGGGVALAVGADGALWLAGRRAVFRRDGAGWGKVAADPAPAPVTALLVAADGTCWIGTESGRVYFARSGDGAWSGVELPAWTGGWIRALAEDRRGRVWAGGNEGGVAFGRAGERWSVWGADHGLHREGVLAILADREGTMWFAVNGHGLQQWIGEAWSHRVVWEGDAKWLERRSLVFGVAGTRDGRLLAAVFNRGLWRWDGREMRELGAAQGLVEDVRRAVEPEPGVVWAAGRYGLFESRGGAFRRVLEVPSGFVYGCLRAPDGTWYAHTSAAGIFRRTADGWRAAEELNRELPNANVRDLLWRGNGELWAATMGGVAVFDAGGGAHVLADDGDPSTPAGVNSLLEVDGEVWMGDFGGIRVWSDGGGADRGGAERRWAEDDGLPGHTIYALARAPGGAVWAGGAAGVGRWDGTAWTLYDTSNGLIEAECNLGGLWPAPDGSVYVGTMASLARFDAGVEPLPPAPLRLFWRRRPQPSSPQGEARLPASERSVRLAWIAPWLTPRRVEYRTRIPRLSPEWSPPQAEPGLTLESLGPGPWRVEVAARLVGEREWTEPIAAGFRIAPYFWETWTFYALCAAAALAAVVGAVRWRTRRLAARARARERAVREQVAQIKVLGGLLPICSSCKKVRDDAGYWRQIEIYIREHSEAEFSHGLCPDCFVEHYPEYAEVGAGARPGEGVLG